MGFVYVLHFDKPYKHAKHYVGFSEEDPEKPGGRIDKHRKGQGSNLMKIIVEAGITFRVARVWWDVDRHFERRKKNSGGASRYCPICKKEHKENGSN